MKLIRLILLSLAVGLCASAAFASIGTVTSLTATGSAVICIPGEDDQIICIQNTGASDVRLSFDGGAGFIPPTGGKPGTNPTPTTGYLLKSGTQIILTTLPYVSNPSFPGLHKPIVAIMVSSTTTLSITTDGAKTQFPTN